MIEPEPQTQIWRDERYRYWYGNEQLWSISQIMRWTGIKKTHLGVDPAVLEWAAERGKAIEQVLFAFMQGKEASIDVPDWKRQGKTLAEDVEDRIPAIQSFLENEKPEYIAHHQYVADLEAGIAGELDVVCKFDGVLTVCDCKATASIEKDWPLQLGFLLDAAQNSQDVVANVAVIHFQKSLAKGYKLRHYDRDKCLNAWRTVRKAWTQSKVLFEDARVRVEGML